MYLYSVKNFINARRVNMLSLPSVEEIIENKLIALSKSEELSCGTVYLEDSFSTLVHSIKGYSSVTVMDSVNGKKLGYIQMEQIVDFLHDAYKQLKAFYDSVIQTTDASVTVIDANEQVRTWTAGAEKIFSVKSDEILGKPITDFFKHEDLEILQTLHSGKKINGQYHQPRANLFVLINSNPVYFKNQIIGAVVSETNVTNQMVLNEKLFEMSTEVHRLEQEMAKYRPSDPFDMIKGKNPLMKKTIQMAKKVCTVKSTVLILGDSGVGKEVFAQAIHESSEGSNAPFISINCGAIPASLFESELFGYERGAFSGADHRGKKGKIELAKGGTLFLDEIGEMPLEMQVKLLRVLQERKYYRVGGEKEIETDFRVIAATNRDLKELMKEGQFREDLYYRLNVVSLKIPPLKKRREDLFELIHYFLNEVSLRYQRPIHQFSQEVMQEMLQYDWPGNVRELRNVVERLVVFATDGIIRKEYLPFHVGLENDNPDDMSIQESNADVDSVITPLQIEMDQHEKRVIKKALALTHGNKLECANKLGITRATLYNRLKRLGLN